MPIEVTLHEATTVRGVCTGSFEARAEDGREGALHYDTVASRWILRVESRLAADLLDALFDRCVAVAESRGVTLVPGCKTSDRMLAKPRRRHVASVLPERTETHKTIPVSPGLASFCAELVPQTVERREGDEPQIAVRGEQAEAVVSSAGARIEWYPNGAKGRLGWERVVHWSFAADRTQLRRIGGGEVTTVAVSEVIIEPDIGIRLELVEQLFDAWVGDGTIVLRGEPEGPPRTRLVKHLARAHLPWFEQAWSIAESSERQRAAAALTADLLDSPHVDDVFAEDLEIYVRLLGGFWGRG